MYNNSFNLLNLLRHALLSTLVRRQFPQGLENKSASSWEVSSSGKGILWEKAKEKLCKKGGSVPGKQKAKASASSPDQSASPATAK